MINMVLKKIRIVAAKQKGLVVNKFVTCPIFLLIAIVDAYRVTRDLND